MKKPGNIITGLIAIGTVLLVASATLFWAGCCNTVSWMNDKHEPEDIYTTTVSCLFVFGETNCVELGIRADGVVVWRKVP